MSAVLIPSRRSMSHLKKPWRVEAKAGEPAGRVAARVLRQRLKTIPRMLRAAAAHGDDHQPIHALRVATRRCTAALDTFGKLLPEKKRRWFAKQLKTLRRVAGEARDLDLLVERVGAQALGGSCGPAATTRRRAKEGARGSSSVLAMLTPMQEAARKPIRRARRQLSGVRWQRRVRRLIAAISGRRAEEPFGTFAARRLAATEGAFLRAVAEGPPAPEALHALRILAKQTRYAIEILGVTSPVILRLRSLVRFQDQAGEVVDLVHAGNRFQRMARRAGDAPQQGALAALSRRESALARVALKNLRASIWLGEFLLLARPRSHP